jgi:prepilin-type N-terminal cleavage/methylation domain-containing protein
MSGRNNRGRRNGFTLVELLVVIAIIGVLAALTTAAVQQVRKRGREATIIEEITQLEAACTKFKQDFGFNVPQTFTFPDRVNRNDPNYAKLCKMFRGWPVNRESIADGTTFTAANIPHIMFRGQDMSGQTITGSKCLVFFLGGPELLGFQVSGPYAPTANATSRKGPYYEFKTSRLDYSSNTDIHSYRDPYGTPYAFFSTGESDRYDPNFALSISNVDGTNTSTVRAVGTTANNAAATSVKWLKMGGVQIMSAGYDKKFGGGIVVTTPAPNPPTYTGWQAKVGEYGGSKPGEDDFANFNGGLKLGAEGN